jgi:hypothetical protein
VEKYLVCFFADFAEIIRGVGFESRVIISADYTDGEGFG